MCNVTGYKFKEVKTFIFQQFPNCALLYSLQKN